MPRNDQETFAHLTAQPDTSYEINLLTYALFADEKSKWIEHFFNQHGTSPSAEQTEQWISNITDQHFEHMRLKAARYFDAAARLYMREEMDEEKKNVLESSIIKEVKAAGSFWRQIGTAVLTAVLAPIIIGGVIAASLAYNDVFPKLTRISASTNSGE
ncbi:MAG: hypothetical protein KJ947_15805 [Alphaproteobacteria bacterium]|jgi:hypothetical protein|nr:hypothetical protein [Alphaproteobacteria bacterium]MBU1551025.1 hypothetical protein [Alphaproteobacteria bacterium]MBU2339161.1 hypothetical protein [Alphaproteobacteria bacterium]MBU2387252.1 hypothetical protein [Alphaproteobacteria bacterium]